MVHLHLGCLFPRQELTKLTPQLCAPQNNTPKPVPYPISVSSAAFGNCQDAPSAVSVSSRGGCVRPRGGCSKAVPGQPGGHGCCPGTGLWFGAQLPHTICSPGWVSAAGQAEWYLSPRTSETSRCAAWRHKYLLSCCPPDA